MDSALASFLSTFNNFVKKPQEFLSVQEEITGQIKDLIKQVYDHTKETEDYNDKKTLPKLIVNEFDEEQIWQQLELQNESCADEIVQIFSHLTAKKDKLKFPLKLKCHPSKNEDSASEIKETEDNLLRDDVTDENDKELSDDEEDFMEDEGDVTGEEEDLSENDQIISQKRKLKPSIVDDKFFKLSELEVFLQNEDKKEDKPNKEKDNYDLFDNIDDQEVANYKYSDFFAKPDDEPDVDNMEKEDSVDDLDESDEGDSDEDNKTDISDDFQTNERISSATSGANDDAENEKLNKDPSKKKVKFALLDSDDDDDIKSEDKSTNPFQNSKKTKTEKNNNEPKSSFEERQERLERVIGRLEEDAMSEKPWQLKGEITASSRPQNSLLEEAVDFDLSVRPAPVISEEVTLRLEDIIMQRIKDKAWDDVERKVKPVDTPLEFKKKLALDQEKSKLSLAEVYEQEFIKQREAATADTTERQEVEPALHIETRSMLHALFNKLDALSNYHFTPRPVAPELKVVSNVSAVVMEEVAPVAVADSTLLAPQEIRGKKRRVELHSKEERTETDKKRARRLKKTRQRQRQREQEKMAKQISKMNPGLGNKYSKIKAQTDILKASNNISKMEENKERVIKSSTAFFNKLQDEVKSHITTKTSLTKKKDKRNITAKKLKL